MRDILTEAKGRLKQDAYLPISDYALIGDMHTAALVSSAGSIDWLCLPRFDSPAVFCRLLDARKGGFFSICPVDAYHASHTYLDGTNILVTTFVVNGGRARLTDFMPVTNDSKDEGSVRRVIRLVEGLSGEMEFEVVFRPTFDFAAAPTSIAINDRGAVARTGNKALSLDSFDVVFHVDGDGAARARFRVAAGDHFWFSLSYSAPRSTQHYGPDELKADYSTTARFWRDWLAGCQYDGPYEALVKRSALVLKLLTYAPSGGLIAAPTTSLPEIIGGVRNWDYRYVWLRDASLVLQAFMDLGFHGEAMAFFEWLESLCINCRGLVQPAYRIDGNPDLPESTLDHLEGYLSSRPVRIGNEAADQIQIDMYGHVLDAACVCWQRMRKPHPPLWPVLTDLADRACSQWKEKDHGIWEPRKTPEHYLHSKLLLWVALDRAVWLARHAGLKGDIARWLRARAQIRRAILIRGYNLEIGAFTQTLDGNDLDASALVLPLVGFLPANDPRMRSTVERIQKGLSIGGLIHRYRSPDGLAGQDAAFVLCNFWLVDNLALQGGMDKARALFEQLVGYANDLGLLPEEIGPKGRLLGNFPQAYTHLALIRSAYLIAKTEEQLRRPLGGKKRNRPANDNSSPNIGGRILTRERSYPA